MAEAVAARTGDEMSGPALLVTGLAVTGFPVVASWLLAGLTVSAAVGGPLLGVLLDRARRPGRLLAWCLSGYAAGLLMVLYGLGRVPDAALVAGLAGPAVVGVMAAADGGGAAVLVCVGLLVAALPVAWTLPARGGTVSREPGDGVRRRERGDGAMSGEPGVVSGGSAGWGRALGESVRREMLEGFAVIVRNGALRRATAGSMISCAGLAVLVVSAPVLGVRLTSESGYGALLLAVTAACGLAANTVVAARGEAWRCASLKITSFAIGSALAGPLVAYSVTAALLMGAALQAAAVAVLAAPRRKSPAPTR